jgi:hypothetical protein
LSPVQAQMPFDRVHRVDEILFQPEASPFHVPNLTSLRATTPRWLWDYVRRSRLVNELASRLYPSAVVFQHRGGSILALTSVTTFSLRTSGFRLECCRDNRASCRQAKENSSRVRLRTPEPPGENPQICYSA